MSKNNGKVGKDEKIQSGELKVVPVSSIRRFHDQPRDNFDPESLEALAQNILAYGLQQPITVVVLENDREFKYEIMDGERRWRAHKIAGIETITVIVDHETTPGTQHMKSLIANFHREGHTIADISNALAREKKAGATVESLMIACGKSDAWVYQHLALQNLHPQLFELLNERSNDKKLRLMPAYELSKLPENQQLEVYEKMKEVPGANEKIELIKSVSGVPVVPRAKRPDREAEGLVSFAKKVVSTTDRFGDLKESELKVILKMFKPQEISDLVSSLEAGNKALAEMISILKKHQLAGR